MDDNKKYFGMTTTQIAILAGLAGLAILLFCIVGALIVRNGLGTSPIPQATSTAAPQPTATITLTPTQTATPAPTAMPYESFISFIPKDWVQYRTALYEIWMMPGYKSAKADPLVVGLGASPILDLSLRGSVSSKSPNKVYVTIAYEPLASNSLDEHINQHIAALGIPVSERSHVEINTIPATRVIFTLRKSSTVDINELTYIFLDGTTIWYVQYTAEISEFYTLLPAFESSAKTFRVVK